MPSLKQKISTDILVSGLLDLSTRIRGIVFLPVLSGTLGVASYGAYMQLLAVTGLIGLFSRLSLRPGYENFSQDDNIDSSSLYYAILIFMISTTILTSAIVSIFSRDISVLTLETPEYGGIFAIGAAIIPLTAFEKMGLAHYRAQMRLKTSAALKALQDYSQIGTVLIGVFLLDFSLEGIVFLIVTIQFGFVVLLQGTVIKEIGISKPSLGNIPTVLAFSGWFTVSNIASQVASRVDRVMLGFFLGSFAVGIYSISYGFASLLLIFISPVRKVFFPEFSRLLSEGKEDAVNKFTALGVHFFLLLAIPSVVGLYFVSEPILQLFTTASEAHEASRIVPIIAIGIFFYGFQELHATGLLADKMVRPISVIWSVVATLNIVLNIFLIIPFGVSGAAFATAITYASSSAIVYVLFLRRFTQTSQIDSVVKIMLATMGMAICIELISVSNFVSTIVLGVVTYSILIISIGGVDFRPIKEVVIGDGDD